MKQIREKWQNPLGALSRGQGAICAHCGAQIYVQATGNPYRKGMVETRCTNDACEFSSKWTLIHLRRVRNGL